MTMTIKIMQYIYAHVYSIHFLLLYSLSMKVACSLGLVHGLPVWQLVCTCMLTHRPNDTLSQLIQITTLVKNGQS